MQQEKLSTLGELIAGIGHEINNPISFISSNIPPLEEYISGVTELLLLYEQEYPNPTAKITTAIKNLDLSFVLEDMGKILNSLQLGSERIQNLSNSLRTFCRSDSDTKIFADLHQGLDSTLMILQHRLKANGDRPRIEVIKSYGVLPEVSCYIGQMNQVFMNILALMAERIESLKAGIIGGLSVCFAFAIASLLNNLVLAKYFQILASLRSDVNWHLWVSGAVATFTGLLFGVTYRYIIRSDKNPQLKVGGVLAFGLVRGLTQIELGWDSYSTIWPFLVLAGESLLWFALAAIALDIAIQLR